MFEIATQIMRIDNMRLGDFPAMFDRWLVPVLIVGNVLTLPVQLLQSDLGTRILQLRDARHGKELRGS